MVAKPSNSPELLAIDAPPGGMFAAPEGSDGEILGSRGFPVRIRDLESLQQALYLLHITLENTN